MVLERVEPLEYEIRNSKITPEQSHGENKEA